MNTIRLDEIIKMVLKGKPHVDIIVAKDIIINPKFEGFIESIGEPQGQIKDYRKEVDNKSIHVREFEGYYTVHWDEVDPHKDPFGHLVKDSPHWLAIMLIGCLIVGGIIANYLISKSSSPKYRINL